MGFSLFDSTDFVVTRISVVDAGSSMDPVSRHFFFARPSYANRQRTKPRHNNASNRIQYPIAKNAALLLESSNHDRHHSRKIKERIMIASEGSSPQRKMEEWDSRSGNHEDESVHHESIPDYPTADTVPFPYETPYPQQRDLMEAMLSTLRLCDSRLDNNTNTNNKQQQQRASVMMLESPTGTGKSLSLACAAVS
eukprot:scaffold220519_cov20-Attheya_sp.AAC.1